ncbi:hypothetical protein ACFY7C_04705 [Streptomyces sp. NPDC012769]|uniref:hypothetical protein n=1 Tax=Streptomyces sp. NPDC012769 TaxID=3364848 RepID=UPI0036C3AE27
MAKRSNTLGATRIRLALAGLGLGALIALGAAGTAMADGVVGTDQGGAVGTATQVTAPTPTPTPTDDKDWNSTGS